MTCCGWCRIGGNEMPFFVSRVNVPMTKEQEVELKSRMGQAIGLVQGKSEEYLLLDFQDNCRLWLRGDNSRPAAYIEAAIFGNEGHAGYDALTAEVTLAFHEVLGIPPENVYLKYDDITAWGVGGMYIDRRLFQ